MADKVKLNESDWVILFPQKEYRLGTTALHLVPLSLKSLATVMSSVNKIAEDVAVLNIDFGNLTDNPKAIVSLVELIVKESPDILSELSGLDVEDISKLPLGTAVDLFSACLDVNLTSQDGLIKNFQRLGEKVTKMTMGNPLQ